MVSSGCTNEISLAAATYFLQKVLGILNQYDKIGEALQSKGRQKI
jgi:hypothetical protein